MKYKITNTRLKLPSTGNYAWVVYERKRWWNKWQLVKKENNCTKFFKSKEEAENYIKEQDGNLLNNEITITQDELNRIAKRIAKGDGTKSRIFYLSTSCPKALRDRLIKLIKEHNEQFTE